MPARGGSKERQAEETRTKVAIVTGGSNGIGLQLCKLLRDDYITCSLDKNYPFIFRDGIKHIDCDITSTSDIRRALEIIGKPIDLLVNNAALLRRGDILNIPANLFHEIVKTNIFGNWLALHEIHKRFAPNAMILQMSSERAIYPRSDVGIYGLTKLFLMEMAFQVKQSNPEIRVKVALPGPVDTAMLRNVGVERCKALEDVTISPKRMADFLMRLLRSDYDMLRFDDPRETASGKTGKYILEDFEGNKPPIILN